MVNHVGIFALVLFDFEMNNLAHSHVVTQSSLPLIKQKERGELRVGNERECGKAPERRPTLSPLCRRVGNERAWESAGEMATLNFQRVLAAF